MNPPHTHTHSYHVYSITNRNNTLPVRINESHVTWVEAKCMRFLPSSWVTYLVDLWEEACAKFLHVEVIYPVQAGDSMTQRLTRAQGVPRPSRGDSGAAPDSLKLRPIGWLLHPGHCGKERCRGKALLSNPWWMMENVPWLSHPHDSVDIHNILQREETMND